MPKIKASLLYFVMVLGTGFVLGVIRVLLLVPRMGERYAELSEMPIMFVVIVFSARYVTQHFRLARSVAVRLQVGFAALALSVAAELILAVIVQNQSIVQYIASRDPVSGSVYLLLLLVFALMPSLLLRFREGATQH